MSNTSNAQTKPQPSEEQAKAKMTRDELGRLHELLEKYQENCKSREQYGTLRCLAPLMLCLEEDIQEHDQGSDEVKARILQR